MEKKPFQVKLTENERWKLEILRGHKGLRSHADVIRSWIDVDYDRLTIGERK